MNQPATPKSLKKAINPWFWIPSLYYAEGIPLIIISVVSVLMYKKMDVSNADITFYTSWLYLPWVIKPLWSPFVDIFRTKRFWIILTQFLMGAGFACVALVLPLPDFFKYSIMIFWLLAFNSATHDISADGFYMIGLDEHQQSLFVGIRSIFYRLAMLSGQGVFVMLAGILERYYEVRLAWSIAFIIPAILFLLIALYHFCFLPRPAEDLSHHEGRGTAAVLKDFIGVFKSFFAKHGIIAALAFLLLYRLGEAQLLKVTQLFLLEKRDAGGMGLSVEQIGMIYGTVGTAMMIFGGVLGGLLIARYGLRRMLWVMIFAIHLPDLFYVYMAMSQPESIIITAALVVAEQFGYGFGFTAYMMFMVYFADGEYKTSHYAIMTGIMALGLMLPGMWAGDLQMKLGYGSFFIWVCLSTIPSFIAVALLNIPGSFGKKRAS